MNGQARAAKKRAYLECITTDLAPVEREPGRYFGHEWSIQDATRFFVVGSAASCVEAARCELVLLDVEAGEVLRGGDKFPLIAGRDEVTGSFYLVCGDVTKLRTGPKLRVGLYINSGGPVTAGVSVVNLTGWGPLKGDAK